MITTNKLFYRRFISYWKFQYNVWRTVIDWMVAIYIVIPFIAFGVYQYLLWWRNPPAVLGLIPSSLIMAIFYCIAWSGNIRIFIQQADQLFLLQQQSWIRKIIKLSITYSLIWHLFMIGFQFLLIGPFLVICFNFTAILVLKLFFISYLLGVCLQLIKQLVGLRIRGYKRSVFFIALFICAGLVYINNALYVINNLILFLSIFLLLLLFLGLLVRIRINIKGSFVNDVERENAQLLKYSIFLFKLSGVNIEKKKIRRKRPLLFYNSNRIFKKRSTINVLVELCIKTVLRNSKYLLNYVQFMILSTLFVGSFPFWWRLVLWVIFSAIFVRFVSIYWQAVMASEFVSLFQWKVEDRIFAARKALFLMTIPGFLLMSFVLGFQSFSWVGALMALLLGGTSIYYITVIFSYFV